MPSDVTIQKILDQGLSGLAVMLGLAICGMVLLMILNARASYVMARENRETRQRHDKMDDESLRARIEHTKELARLSDYVNASITSQRSIQSVLEAHMSTLKVIDEHVQKTENTAVSRYASVLTEVKSYTSTVGAQIDLLPSKLRDELKPVINQLTTIEKALQESQKKTDEIGVLLKGTELTLMRAIDEALKIARQSNGATALTPLLSDGIG